MKYIGVSTIVELIARARPTYPVDAAYPKVTVTVNTDEPLEIHEGDDTWWICSSDRPLITVRFEYRLDGVQISGAQAHKEDNE
jgi:hypothetical protein